MDHQPAEETPRCPVCGASLQSGVVACAACGTLVADMFPSPAAWPLEPTALTASVPSASGTPEAAAAGAALGSDPATIPASGAQDAVAEVAGADGGDTWRCGWCGQTNTTQTEQCAHCGALFPRPEADAALQRLADARMRAELDALDTLQRRRNRKGLGRLFSN